MPVCGDVCVTIKNTSVSGIPPSSYSPFFPSLRLDPLRKTDITVEFEHHFLTKSSRFEPLLFFMLDTSLYSMVDFREPRRHH